MIVIDGVTTQVFSSDIFLQTLANLCTLDLHSIYERCAELGEMREKAKCKSRIAFTIHYARKTGMIYESDDGGVLYFVPCLLYYRAVSSYLYEKPRMTRDILLVSQQNRRRWIKVASEEILKHATTDHSGINKNNLKAERLMRDIKSAVKWISKSPLYRPLMQYIESLSTTCRAVHYLLSVIPAPCNNISSCEFNKLMSTYLLGFLVAFSEALVKLEYEGRLTVKDTVENFKEITTSRITRISYDEICAKSVGSVIDLKTQALLEYLSLLVNSSALTYVSIERFTRELEKYFLARRTPNGNFTNEVKTLREIRKLKWICRKLLRYNMAFRMYKEVSRLNSEVADVLLKVLL